MLFTATHNVCVKSNNPSPVLNVPEGQAFCNTGQYIQLCCGGGCVEQHEHRTRRFEGLNEIFPWTRRLVSLKSLARLLATKYCLNVWKPVSRDWRKLRRGELQYWHFSTNIIRVFKWRERNCIRQVAHKREKCFREFSWEIREKGNAWKTIKHGKMIGN